ncbi:MAG: hypothetical protein A3F90_04055 [Deltaproteobacteria bacterium RIFCSPLOWO2_12_FULL_60_19]|nr:MAG: hypothetical protein A3F90_04055 [Deltaproteobacteria bacterium RIFCSPLOWO2_12_FULL_60_19]
MPALCLDGHCSEEKTVSEASDFRIAAATERDVPVILKFIVVAIEACLPLYGEASETTGNF